MPSERLLEPWRSFLAEIDGKSPALLELHCIGGFAASLHYGLERPTGDIDLCRVVPDHAAGWLVVVAGQGSSLHKKHRVWLEIVTVATVPEGYAERLTEVFAGQFKRLRMFVLDPYDLALSKLERNSEVDIEDVKHLGRAANFDPDTLAARYQTALRPFLAGPESRHDLTLKLWLEAIAEERGLQPPLV